ncbi:hypothetical protein SARC_04128 [Sphaeroforma arctica JP610]|uniref:Uncharacterized protein n=1 Tax=Sphaeroforma arctica JP610 TaxID=667725 RepID=A0A0L0G443_9EUKA|nr:hypothetical protein SARC_04128 [Sphaeroforma arctica JP610]KNC83629.1 hypothetical protein SARC_04128 [Sphaeroforma arctica JP610]|eukprot:XP_014157531.1 hypothetical protein SARC_04128 [Sphaeroforma arctica JP610]
MIALTEKRVLNKDDVVVEIVLKKSAADPEMVKSHALVYIHELGVVYESSLATFCDPYLKTGKTSLAKSLAQKISIRMNDRFSYGQLITVNSHSVLSKFFSESGKLVQKLFQQIHEVLHPDTFVCVLVDEIESLATSRATSSSDPSDSVRAVNAMLTQLDKLAMYANILIIATTNLTGALDAAFVDRADLCVQIALPNTSIRYEILRRSLQDLIRCRIISTDSNSSDVGLIRPYHTLTENSSPGSQALLRIAKDCENLSGRALKRLAFVTHLSCAQQTDIPLSRFLEQLAETSKTRPSGLGQ